MFRITLATVGVLVLGIASILVLPGQHAGAVAPFSDGVYRLPYEDGVDVFILNDHLTHPLAPDRVDFNGSPADGTDYNIVAAATGVIEAIEDSETINCTDSADVAPLKCSDFNNYVWISHPNGEWTKYSHFQTGSVVALGHQVGDPITVGTVLGLEGDIGAAFTVHVHFEVGIPTDLNDPFAESSGFIKGVNRVPVFCDVPGNVVVDGDTRTADDCTNAAPDAEPGGPYFAVEGVSIPLDGTASSDPEGAQLDYLWTPAGGLSDPTSATPTLLPGKAGPLEYQLTVTDQGDQTTLSSLSDTEAVIINVANTPPALSVAPILDVDEGEKVIVSGFVTDQGWLTDLAVTIDWDDGLGPLGVAGLEENLPPDATMAFNTSRRLRDNGIYNIVICGIDEADAADCESQNVVVANVDPTAELDEAIYHETVGASLSTLAGSADPGSDDLTFNWDWDTGTVDPATTVLVSLAAPPVPDPPKSPLGDARAETPSAAHTYTVACSYEIELTVVDDDGGSTATTAIALIIGDSTEILGAGLWRSQFRPQPPNDYTTEELECLLGVVRGFSSVFDEERGPLLTREDASAVLSVQGAGGDPFILLDRQLLAAWLNFASGGFDADMDIHLDDDGVADTTFEVLMADAEAARLDPGAATDDLLWYKDVLDALNASG